MIGKEILPKKRLAEEASESKQLEYGSIGSDFSEQARIIKKR